MRKEKKIIWKVFRRTICTTICMLLLLLACTMFSQTVTAAMRTFTHPGMLHTEESFAVMKVNVENEVQPSVDTWNNLIGNGFSAADWQPRETDTVVRGGDGSNFAAFHIDIRRAYQTALIWKISGSEEHGEAVCRILNAWSGTMTTLTGNADRFLAAGIYGYELANVSEIMRNHPSFNEENMENLLLEVFYPMTDDFLTNHNGAHFGNYWANWDLCNIASMMAIGIYTDRADIYEQALDYYRNGIGMGSLYNAMPYVYEEGLAQWQESGRDQGHTTFGISLCGAICEMAWNQGDDLYSLSDNRFLKAAEYVAKYNNMEDVPYNTYERYAGQSGKSEFGEVLSDHARGMIRPVYSLVYNHYVTRMGLEAPNIEKVLFTEDGYRLELECSNGDELGWQTLTFFGTGEPASAKEAQGILPDGIYRIRSAHTGKSLIANEEGALSSARRGSNEAEWWKFENTGDGEYIITNTVTGQVLQIEGEMYANDSIYTTGENKDALNQRFAVIQNDTGDYRILSSVNGFAISLRDEASSDDTPVIQWKYFSGKAQKWYIETVEDVKEVDKFVRADFTFDNEETGFICDKAVANGDYTLTNSYNEDNGKAVYLDAGAQQHLEITDIDGNPLLAGATELTISFEAKPDRTDTNWALYIAPDDKIQTYTKEKYIGVMLRDGGVVVERYNNNGKRPASISAESGSDWMKIDVVLDAGGTELYINGVKAAEETSWYSVADIIGDNGIIYIGRANWREQGEYFQGWIDNLTICNRALTQEQLETLNGEDVTVPDFEVEKEKLPYVDVSESDWFYDAVYYNYIEETMTGMDATHFGPYGHLSRAQFALILYRMTSNYTESDIQGSDSQGTEGESSADRDKKFHDIVGDEWYGPAVLWAAENSIVTGYQDGNFGPADMITREQIAVMMYRYAYYISRREAHPFRGAGTVNYLGENTGTSESFSGFTDAAYVSEFASDAMNWAVGNNIITGKDGGTKLDPQGNTARSEAAAIVQRFMTKK